MGRKGHRRAKKQQNKFEQKWTCESMCAYQRNCLNIAITNTELKSDELEKPVFVASFLRATFQVENGNITPLRVAILLQANQITSNFNFHEFSQWLQICQIGLQWQSYPEAFQVRRSSQK